MAKGIGNGFPMAAVVTTPQIAQFLSQATHFNTFGGNPMASAVGSAVLEVRKTLLGFEFLSRARHQRRASEAAYLSHGAVVVVVVIIVVVVDQLEEDSSAFSKSAQTSQT